MTNPTSNFGWVMPTNASLVTNLPADFNTFGQAVDTSMSQLKGGTTGQILSKTSSTDMAFTWITNDVGDITAVSVTSPLTGGGTSGAVTVGIQDASTAQKGSVQLSDSTSTTSSVLAATPTAVKSAYDLAAAAIPKSTVTAKGSIVAATGSSTPANLAVGNNGETLVADSSATTGLRYVATPSASNPVINAAMQVAQRGTSINVGASVPTFCLDRWMLSPSTNTFTVAQQATSDTTNLPSIQFCSRVQRTAGQTGTNIAYYAQSFETINSRPFAGKTVTMSFYARAGADYSAASSVLGAFLVSGTGTDQNVLISYTGSATVATSNVTLTTTWKRFTITGSVGATATELATYFGFTPVGTAGANDYYEVTGVQVDIGNVALPFRTYAATFQGELAACQRYYFRAGANSGGTTSAFSTYGQGFTSSTTEAYAQVYFPQTMRVNPTDIGYGNVAFADSAGNFNNLVSIAFNQINTNSVNLYCYGFTGLTANRPGRLANNNNTAGYFYASSEL